eukprot:1918014-Amphidinium_carterae.2
MAAHNRRSLLIWRVVIYMPTLKHSTCHGFPPPERVQGIYNAGRCINNGTMQSAYVIATRQQGTSGAMVAEKRHTSTSARHDAPSNNHTQKSIAR